MVVSFCASTFLSYGILLCEITINIYSENAVSIWGTEKSQLQVLLCYSIVPWNKKSYIVGKISWVTGNSALVP